MTAAALLHSYGYTDDEIQRGVELVRASMQDDTKGPARPEEVALLTMYVVAQRLIDAGYDARLKWVPHDAI